MSFTGNFGGSGVGDKGLRYGLFETLRLAWADEDLRRRLSFILLIFGIYVLGVNVPVPVPGIDPDALAAILEKNPYFSLMNTMGGGAFKRVSVFALGLGPYIVASIILQVITMGYPKWKEEMKEGGEYARKQQNRRTRALTLGLCFFQGFGLLGLMRDATAALDPMNRTWVVIFWMAGSMFLLWLGEQVSEKGIGNGISVLIFAGIVIALPNIVQRIYESVATGLINWFQAFMIAVLFAVTTWLVVMFTVAQRRIPIQHMRRNFGTKSMGGQVSYLPVAVAMAGVIPIIFALTLVYLPSQLASGFPAGTPVHEVLANVAKFSPDFRRWEGLVGILAYTGLIFFFTYFWTALQYNVDDIADNLKKGGSYIQGIRPGKQTRDFLNSVISRVTFIGAIFLALAAMTQFTFPLIADIPSVGLIAGTSLLIMVSVGLETMRQIEANLITKQYES